MTNEDYQRAQRAHEEAIAKPARKLPVCWKCGRAIRDAEYTQEHDGTARHLNACPV